MKLPNADIRRAILLAFLSAVSVTSGDGVAELREQDVYILRDKATGKTRTASGAFLLADGGAALKSGRYSLTDMTVERSWTMSDKLVPHGRAVFPKGVEMDSLKPFPVLRPVPDRLRDGNRRYQSCPSITASRGGRLWVSFMTGDGDEGNDNAVVVLSSGDGGKTWSPPLFAIDAPGPLRTLDSGLWSDEKGDVWLFYPQVLGFWDGRGGLWAMRAKDPESERTEWTAARRISDGYLKNKPTRLRDGRLLLPIEFFEPDYIGFSGVIGDFSLMPFDLCHDNSFGLDHANVFEASDGLTDVRFLGQAQHKPKEHTWPEHMIVERRDGSLWMLMRMRYGLGESVSTDGGKTWSEVRPASIAAPSARFHLSRLTSGALLLVKNGDLREGKHRNRIFAYLSDDDGRTWLGGLELDARNDVSYPDAVETADGFIHVVNDFSRTKAAEIVHHRFTEADIRAGKVVSPGSRLGDLVNRAAAPLAETFDRPPRTARPHTWYHLMNGNVSKEGITRDFEALAAAGVGGVQMFDAGCGVPPGPMVFNSPEWIDLMLHADREARRLGLEIVIPNCSGWSSSGGPWVQPSNGMKRVVTTVTRLKGPAKSAGRLPRVKGTNGYYEDIAVLAFPTPAVETELPPDVSAKLSDRGFVLSAEQSFSCRGVAFRLDYNHCWNRACRARAEVSDDGTAFRPLETFDVILGQGRHCDHALRHHPFRRRLSARAIRVTFEDVPDNLAFKVAEAKAETRLMISDLGVKTFEHRGYSPRDSVVPAKGESVDAGKVMNVLCRLKSDDTLDWPVPPGDWTVLRVANVCNGAKNGPASAHGQGLEIDKLSASAMDFHFEQYVGKLCRALDGKDRSLGFGGVLVDSFEIGCQNWTPGLDRIFRERKGYSLVGYLPVFGGYVVNSIETSERFLEDFRDVVAELFAENYSGAMAEKCHQYGMRLSVEPYGNCPADNLRYGDSVDIPMAEFWSLAAKGEHAGWPGNARFAAYLGHVWGRRYIGAEAFTANPRDGGRWQTTPYAIKAQGDMAFAHGVNRLIFHRFAHQPNANWLPGMTMGQWGIHFDRTQTWWPLAGEWLKYLTRCQALLQEGTFVADAVVYAGDEVPNESGNSFDAYVTKGGLSFGNAWDYCSRKALAALRVENGEVVAPGGVRYRLLALGKEESMSLETLGVIESLIDRGAKVSAERRPERVPGLRGYPQADGRLAAEVSRIWKKGVFEMRPTQALRALGVGPDVEMTGGRKFDFDYIHRRNGEADWYFLSMRNRERCAFEVSFRQTGRIPELWDAVTGERRDASTYRIEKDRTFVSLDFDPAGSVFVVFRRLAGADRLSASAPPPKAWRTVPVEGAWRVTHPIGWYFGTDEEKARTVTLPDDWTMSTDDDIRHFSGTATYEKLVSLPSLTGRRVFLDLGEVKDFVEVSVNGEPYRPFWKPPCRLDVTEAVAANPSALTLRLRVTNLWVNRLIGDAGLPEDCEWGPDGRLRSFPEWAMKGERSPTGRHTFTTWRHWKKDDPLRPSGLLGPVKLEIEER